MTAVPPLLRAPPFPDGAVRIAERVCTPSGAAIGDADIDRALAAIRQARVGGAFWAPRAVDVGHAVIYRPRHDAVVRGSDVAINAVHVPHTANVDPWSLLGPGVHLLAHGDDEWAALAYIAGGTVKLLSPGIYGEAGSGAADLRQRVVAQLFGHRYRDPFTGADIDIDTAIARLASWRRIAEANRGIVAACGIAWWKRREIARLLWSPGTRLRFFRSERRALAHAARAGGGVAVWPSRISATMVQRAATAGVPLIRVEDGFVRSIGLGSDMVPPSSVTVDRLGIHYDPGRPSDLETLLAQEAWSPALLAEAATLRHRIVAARISKYGGGGGPSLPVRSSGHRLVLVPGQVEDDMSVRLGGGGLADNLELLRRARALEPEAEIWFRPHPDVDAGHRKGAVRDADALDVADRIVREGSMAELLDRVDAVHVLTSLTGFEALLRGRGVTCHGMPFYAGWGLTRDLMATPPRRGRALTLDQLVAGVLILYPRYVDPVTALPCGPETLIDRMATGAAGNRLGWVTRIRRLQGRLMKGWR